MDATTILYNDLLTMTDLIADAVVKKVYPVQDDLSTREAYKAYGRVWIEEKVMEGKVRGRRVGGKVIYSRHELDTLRAVERSQGKAILGSIKTI